MKLFTVTCNVGKVKYLVSFHNGIKTHKDGSPFYDVKLFSNKKGLKRFINELLANGYKERMY